MSTSHDIRFINESRIRKDTIDRQHPFLAPAQPKIDVMKSIAPTPMKAKINLQNILKEV
jgi:hypothetical protein